MAQIKPFVAACKCVWSSLSLVKKHIKAPHWWHTGFTDVSNMALDVKCVGELLAAHHSWRAGAKKTSNLSPCFCRIWIRRASRRRMCQTDGWLGHANTTCNSGDYKSSKAAVWKPIYAGPRYNLWHLSYYIDSSTNCQTHRYQLFFCKRYFAQSLPSPQTNSHQEKDSPSQTIKTMRQKDCHLGLQISIHAHWYVCLILVSLRCVFGCRRGHLVRSFHQRRH